jgi:predicted amidophosphoribosyltransferase
MIPVKREPENLGDQYEQCCFCFEPTPFWFELRDVAVCPICAKTAEEHMVPFKDEWIKRIDIREKRFNGRPRLV